MAETFPLLPLRGVLVFPSVTVPLEIGRDRSVRAVDEAMDLDRKIVFASQIDPETDDPAPDDIYRMGTLAEIRQAVRLPGGHVKAIAEGICRVRITDYALTEPFLSVNVERVAVPEAPSDREAEALALAALHRYERFMKLTQRIPDEATLSIEADDVDKLADSIASNLDIKTKDRQEILETVDPIPRLELVLRLLSHQIELLELERKIVARVRRQIDKTQKDYFLREQMKAIRKELGEGGDDDGASEAEAFRAKIEEADLPEEVEARAMREVERLARMSTMSPEAVVSRTYLEWLTELPWNRTTGDAIEIPAVERVLDEDHAGLEKVKTRIVEFLAVKKAVPGVKGPILCLVGPPGVGKTSLGRSIARALGRHFTRVSLGGVRDEAEIRGHRRTYIGALPGRIVQGLRQAGTADPVFLLDEVDKMAQDFRGDPAAALLEVLDPDQNATFSDHYIELPVDLSRVFFVTTANDAAEIPRALLDRMEVIHIPGYTEDEKVAIAQGHALPKILAEHGFRPKGVKLSEDAVREVIRGYTREAGVRNLQRELATIVRKLATAKVKGEKVPRGAIGAEEVSTYLGPRRFRSGRREEKDEVGVATAVYWTEMGGDVMPIEVTLMPGKGKLLLTGKLGEVMQESAQAGFSYIRAHTADLGIRADFYENQDIHIHVPEGATPKEGPSAGITMATALVSALTERPVRADLAMTGEITLRGRVLPIGGLREKILAAHRVGIRTVILPQENLRDLEEIPEVVRREMTFVPVTTMDEVLKRALTSPIVQ